MASVATREAALRDVPAPPAGWASGPLGLAQAADREIARQTALKARALAAFAATRPASVDRPQGQKGAMSAERWAARPPLLRDVSEWAAPEVVIALSISAQAAEGQLDRSLTLAHRLPATLDALESGRLHVGHLWPLLEHVAPIADPVLRAEIEAELLAWMTGRVTTPAQLGAKTRRLVLARNAREAGRRLAAAIKERGIHLRAERSPGMASVTAVMTMPEAQILYRALGAYADALPDDPAQAGAEPRTRGQKMVDCLLDLVLRPGETELPPVRVLLTVVASLGTLLGGDQPGEVDGQVVPAEMIRDLLRAFAGRARASGTVPSPGAGDPAVPSPGAGDPAVPSPGAGDPAVPSPGAGDLAGDALSPDLEVPPDRGSLDGGALGTRPDVSSDPGPLDGGAPGARPDVLPGPDDDPDLARWWDEVERRVLAGELPDEPDPVPDDLLRRWAEGTPAAFRAGSPVDPSAALGDPGADPPAPGWWARADDAVEAAGNALRHALDALDHARKSVHTARKADLSDEAEWRAGPAGRVDAADDALAALAAATAAQRQDLADLCDAGGGGGLADRPRIALVDALSGTLLALSDLPTLRRTGNCGAEACRRRPEACTHDLAGRPGLGPPGPTDGYRPGRELDRWVRARDRRCRFPGCRRRVPKGGELDHVVRHPDGPTSSGNLAGWCTGDHRCKHQAPGWLFELAPDGTVTVTTPTGMTATTTPPPY